MEEHPTLWATRNRLAGVDQGPEPWGGLLQSVHEIVPFAGKTRLAHGE